MDFLPLQIFPCADNWEIRSIELPNGTCITVYEYGDLFSFSPIIDTSGSTEEWFQGILKISNEVEPEKNQCEMEPAINLDDFMDEMDTVVPEGDLYDPSSGWDSKQTPAELINILRPF